MLTVLVMMCAGMSAQSMDAQAKAIRARHPHATVRFHLVRCSKNWEPLE